MFYDPRVSDLAKTLVSHSVEVASGDAVLIESHGFAPQALVEAIAGEVTRAGGIPVVNFLQPSVTRRILLDAPEATVRRLGEVLAKEMEAFQCYLSVRGSDNIYETADVPKERMQWYTKHVIQPVHLERRCKNTRWCVMRYPNESMCQLAETSTEAFTRFYYDVCCVDYRKMEEALQPLKALMDAAESFRLVGQGTDLSFSVKGIGSVPCAGKRNIPDGECFTAPVKDSVNGFVTFNTPSVREGKTFEGIRLEFKDGRAVEASFRLESIP